MSEHRAAEDLAVIRAMMERTATYRRSMAPMLLASGSLGAAAAGLSLLIEAAEPRSFGLYWQGTAIGVVLVALAVMGLQARRKGEAMWSPPARQILRFLLPPFLSGFVFASAALIPEGGGPRRVWLLVQIWLFSYGCGVQAASAMLPATLRVLGWLFIAAGAALSLVLGLGEAPPVSWAHALMGGAFGGLHLVFAAGLGLKDARRDPT